MPEYDSIVRNGTVVDGSGQISAYQADIGIRNGVIAAIGRLRGDAKRELDATGCIVAPGAIELHGHYDAHIQWDPYCTSSGWHGVTTVTLGTCGFGWAPCKPDTHDAYARMMSRIMSVPAESVVQWLRWDWESFPEYLDSLDRQGLGVNAASMVAISPLRAYVMGMEESRTREKMNEAELERLKAVFREAMAAGAFGFSNHRNVEDRHEDGGWLPSHMSSWEEHRVLAEIIGEFGVGGVYWTRGEEEGDGEFLRELCRISGRPLQWSAVVQGRNDGTDTWREELDWSEENLKLGLPMYTQAIPPLDIKVRLAEFNMFDSTPSWCEPLVGSREERIAKLSQPGIREPMKKEFDEKIGFFHGEWDRVLVIETVEERNKGCEGRSIADIAQETGKHPVDAFLDLALDEGLLTEFEMPAFTGSDDAATMAILSAPSTAPGVSDAGAHYRFTTVSHWPTYVLGKWVRDEGAMTLEQAHYKNSGLPAFIMGYRDRGLLREGLAADIVVYELDRLAWAEQEYLHDTPAGDPRIVRKSQGYRYTLVNGEVTFEEGRCTGALPGKLLRSTDQEIR